ncbi:flotillin-like FloA family protein [Dethiobacter alkaliphilus]|uniref:Uncharacterized protein n=1 Tax=Dethiobacter alkaliphilus AHT 1 TaxID=555088 RepID=C0GHQ5_DETAL|nr:flotillin-like FloA family protein [Dethiobacter alkaliphilus]EEG77261.1 conserved hypothetical protein [Dethiobacter alkaliphilus AHT 1]
MELIIIILGLILLFVSIIIMIIPLGSWISTKAAGVPVSIFYFLGMRLRRSNIEKIISSLITAHKAGLDLNIMSLEGYALAGGNVEQVVKTLISARESGKNLSFEEAAKMDLSDGTASADVRQVSTKGCDISDKSLIRARIEEALSAAGYNDQQAITDISYNMTEGLDKLTLLFEFYTNPEAFDKKEIETLVSDFLIHVPNRLSIARDLIDR